MNIAILGGAFDPPHFGHLLAAQQVLDFTTTDEVWLIPCFSHPFNKTMNSSDERLQMTKLCAKEKIKVSSWEIEQKKISYSINTLNNLSKEFREHRFSFIIGSENVASFKKWKNWQEILQKYTVWVFPRLGFGNIKLLSGMREVKNKFLIKSDLSSTKIRERARKRLSLKYFVPQRVVEYIEKNKIYD